VRRERRENKIKDKRVHRSVAKVEGARQKYKGESKLTVPTCGRDLRFATTRPQDLLRSKLTASRVPAKSL